METGISLSTFNKYLENNYPQCDETVQKQFEDFRELLFEVNKVMNLTAINEADEVREKHFMDSLLIEALIPQNASVADIGSGAGFPGIPCAIIRQDVQFDLIEPTLKRCKFMQTVVEKLGLKNVKIINKRAEECSDLNEHYDLVTARAVARLPILLELCIPLLKIGGDFIAMKGSNAIEELKTSQSALDALNLNPAELIETELPHAGKRISLKFHKEIACSKEYPREYRVIKKWPL